MRTTGFSRGLVRTAAFAVTAGLLSGAAGAATTSAPRKEARTAFALSAVRPLTFESNEGQIAAPVRFAARGNAYTLWLSPAETTMSFRKGGKVSALRLTLMGANPSAEIVGLDRQAGHSNYYVGEKSTWREGVPHFGRVAYRDVYPGVNLVHYGNEGELEYDFVVAPGADASAIRMSVEGASRIEIRKNGDLVLKTATGEVVHRAPVVYQDRADGRTAVAGRFVIENKTQVRFEVGSYDRQYALVIDPVLNFATYLGGSANDIGFGIAVDSTGSAYVTGQTASTNFPSTVGPAKKAGTDTFVTRYAYDGQSILFSTYLGGTANDTATSIAVDSDSNAWVAGFTRSTNFPTAGTPVQPTRPGPVGSDDAFVAGLDGDGNLIYGTYLGGGAGDEINSIAVSAGSGHLFVTGATSSTNFPTANPFDATLGSGPDAFVTAIDTGSTSLIYSTYLGGGGGDQGFGIAADDDDNAYVTGRTSSAAFPTAGVAFQPVRKAGSDAFVTVLSSSGTPTYSTFLGGSGDDRGLAIALAPVEGANHPFVTGQTSSTNFPTKRPFQKTNGGGIDAFVTALKPDEALAANTVFYSSYLGGTGDDVGTGIGVGENGDAYFGGHTTSDDFPVINALHPDFGGATDAFAARVSIPGNELYYATYYGGSGIDEANAAAVSRTSNPVAGGNLYLTGRTASGDFPVEQPQQATKIGGATTSDAFVTRLPFLNLERPFHTADWAAETVRFVSWTTNLRSPETITIDLREGGSSVSGFPISGVPAQNLGWFVFVPPFGSSDPLNAELVITWDAEPAIGDSTTFDVAEPFVKVSSPGTGSNFCVGETRVISWTSNLGNNNYDVALDRDGNGSADETIATNVFGSEYNSVQFPWVVTAGSPDPATTAKIIVTATSPTAATGISKNFKIQTCP